MAVRKSRSKLKVARPTTVTAYLASLAPEKRAVIEEARAFVHNHIPKGYAEFMNWGVINWEIPLEGTTEYRQRAGGPAAPARARRSVLPSLHGPGRAAARNER